jgi:hypothetical protein
MQQTKVVPNGNMLPEAGAHSIMTLASQASVAVTTNPTGAPFGPVHSAVMSAGQVMTGGVVSTMVTSKQQVAVLPESSVAVQQTSVVPSGNVLPEAGTHETGTLASQTSVAVAVKFTCAPFVPVHSAVMSAGQVMTGGVVSETVTSNEHWAELFASSVEVHVTMVVPCGKSEPEAGTHELAGVGSQSSVAEKLKETVAPFGPEHSTVMSPGHVGTGGVQSTTSIVKKARACFPVESVTEKTSGFRPSCAQDGVQFRVPWTGEGPVGLAGVSVAPAGSGPETIVSVSPGLGSEARRTAL